MKHQYKKVCMAVLLGAGIAFNAGSAFAAENPTLVGSSTNNFTGCRFKFRNMGEVQQITAVRVNGVTYQKVNSKMDLTAKQKYWLSDVDPEIGLSSVSSNDKVEFITKEGILHVTVKDPDNVLGTIYDKETVRFEATGKQENPKNPQNPKESDRGDLQVESFTKELLGYWTVRMTEQSDISNIREVKVGNTIYKRVNSTREMKENTFVLDLNRREINLNGLSEGVVVAFKTDAGTTKIQMKNPNAFFGEIYDKNIQFEKTPETNVTKPSESQPNDPGKNPSKTKFTLEPKESFSEFYLQLGSTDQGKEIQEISINNRKYQLTDSKYQAWIEGKYFVENDRIYLFRVPKDAVVTIVAKDGSKHSYRYVDNGLSKTFQALEESETPALKPLKVRLKGAFEPAMVNQKKYDGISNPERKYFLSSLLCY